MYDALDAVEHWLIKNIDTKAKCRNLKQLTCKGIWRQVFIRVYRLELQSYWYFRPSTGAPLIFYLVQLSTPSPFPVTKYSICRWLGWGGGCWVLLETIFCMFWPDSEPTKLLDHPKQKPRRGGGLRQINTCRKVPLQINLLRWQHFALVSI